MKKKPIINGIIIIFIISIVVLNQFGPITISAEDIIVDNATIENDKFTISGHNTNDYQYTGYEYYINTREKAVYLKFNYAKRGEGSNQFDIEFEDEKLLKVENVYIRGKSADDNIQISANFSENQDI